MAPKLLLEYAQTAQNTRLAFLLATPTYRNNSAALVVFNNNFGATKLILSIKNTPAGNMFCRVLACSHNSQWSTVT